MIIVRLIKRAVAKRWIGANWQWILHANKPPFNCVGFFESSSKQSLYWELMKVSYLSTFSSWLLLENRRGFSVRKKQKNRNCHNRGTVLVGVIETESFIKIKTFKCLGWMSSLSECIPQGREIKGLRSVKERNLNKNRLSQVHRSAKA